MGREVGGDRGVGRGVAPLNGRRVTVTVEGLVGIGGWVGDRGWVEGGWG